MSVRATIEQRAASSSPPFPHDDPKYQSCFYYMHVKKATLIVLGLNIALEIMSVLNVITMKSSVFWIMYCIFYVILEFAIFYYLYLGVKNEYHNFLLPYLGLTILNIAFAIVLILGSIFILVRTDSDIVNRLDGIFFMAGVYSDESRNVQEIQTSVLITLIPNVIYLVLAAWFFHTVYKCYIYLKELHAFRHSQVMASAK